MISMYSKCSVGAIFSMINDVFMICQEMVARELGEISLLLGSGKLTKSAFCLSVKKEKIKIGDIWPIQVQTLPLNLKNQPFDP